MELWSFLLQALREIGLAGIIIVLARGIVKRFFDRDLASFKAKLNLLATEHQVSYSSVYAKRASVISELYSNLVEAEMKFTLLTAPFEPGPNSETFADKKNWRLSDAEGAYKTFREFYNKNRLYLNKSICKDLDTIIDVFDFAAVRVGTFIAVSGDWSSTQQMAAEVRESSKAITKGPLPRVKAELERQFREILRIND